MLKLMHATEISPSELKDIKYPVYVSHKLDGIRFVFKNHRLLSRTLKELPNFDLQLKFKDTLSNGDEGEIIVGSPYAKNVFKKTTSYVMSQNSKEDMLEPVTLYIFDNVFKPETIYEDRYIDLISKEILNFNKDKFVLKQTLVHNVEELLEFEKNAIEEGAEGIMIRSPNVLYKYGESTLTEMELVKFKRFVDSEAIISEIIPCSKSWKGMGSIIVRDLKTNIHFKIGTGFTLQERLYFWNHSRRMIGKIVKYKYSNSGDYIKPRFPSYLGMRDPIDIIDK